MIVKTINLYENREDVTLTTYVINEKGELNGQGKRPAVIICPGGGYFSCSDREAEPVAMQFAAMGYHAFVLRYSTYTEGKDEFPDISHHVPVKEHLQHPAPVREIGKAMLILRHNEEEWSIDMDRVAVCGFSAGAHNTAMYSVYWDKPLVTDYLGTTKEMIKPAAIILGYTLSDYIFMRDVPKNPMDKSFFENSNIAFLGEACPSEDRLLSVSPARLVDSNTPPTYLWATSQDNMVPVQHTIRMAHALADHGIPFEMHIFEEGPHGLSVSTQASAVSKSMIYPDAAKWIPLAQCWLQKRFALDLPAKTPFEDMMDKQKSEN